MIPKLSGVAGFVLNVEQGLQPFMAELLAGVGARFIGFVEPMRGHAGLSHQMHGFGAHLKLDVQARGTDQRGVQRLVAVEFGDGNVVFELAWHGFVELVQQAQCRVAIDHLGQDEAKTVNVCDLRKAQVFVGHFFVNRVERFFSARNTHAQTSFGKRFFHLFLHPLHQIAAALAGFLNRLAQYRIAPR